MLEDWHGRFHRAEFLEGDPLRVAYRYDDPADREVVALLAAAFASGNIKAILAVLDAMLAPMGNHPARWLAGHSATDLRGTMNGVRHRWVRSTDAEVLLALLGGALREHGSLGALWQSVDDRAERDTLPALARFTAALRGFPIEPLASRERTITRASGKTSALASIESILLTSPERGSACKRMHLFLRWMSRPADGVDLGLWTPFLSPARLVMPVDTHVLRICRGLRFTRRKVADARAAQEITARFRRINPEDPCRYDFALVRAGIAER